MSGVKAGVGVRSRPAVLSDLADDLAVEISLEMRRRGLSITGLRKLLGISPRYAVALSCYLRGSESQTIGVVAALKVAEALEIPVAIRVGDEARELTA